MAGILLKTANRVCRQIFDSATTPRFDEQQLNSDTGKVTEVVTLTTNLDDLGVAQQTGE